MRNTCCCPMMPLFQLNDPSFYLWTCEGTNYSIVVSPCGRGVVGISIDVGLGFCGACASQVQCLRCGDEKDTSQGVWLHPNADGNQPSCVHHRTELWYFTTFLIQNRMTCNRAEHVNITLRELDTHTTGSEFNPNMCSLSFEKMHASDFPLSVVWA